MERIRRHVFGWTVKKPSVTNPLKFDAHNLLYAADFADWVTQQDPARLKYLDESHFENWGTFFFFFANQECVYVCRLLALAVVPRTEGTTRREGSAHAREGTHDI